jgi:hypothetical protein
MLDNGLFDNGPEPMLWRPDLDHARLRRQGVLESIAIEPGPFALVGIAIGFMAGGSVGLVIALAVLALSVWWSVAAYRCWGLDCSRAGWTRHRRDRGAGEWFYRASDFVALPAAGRELVARVFTALVVFDEPMVPCWLGRGGRDEPHRVAWQLLDCLHASLPARALLAQLPADLAGDAEVGALRHQLVQLDIDIAAGVDVLCEASALARDLVTRITQPRRRAALHADLRCLRLPTPPAVSEFRDGLSSRVAAVHDVLDLAGSTP